MIKYYKIKLQDTSGAWAKLQGCFCHFWISWGMCIHNSWVVWISWCCTLSLSRKLQKKKIYRGGWNFFKFKLFMTAFNLAFLFWGEFLSLIQIFKIIKIAKILRDKISEMKMEPSVTCVCLCVYVCVCVIKPEQCRENDD